MAKHPTIILNNKTYNALLRVGKHIDDPRTGSSPISFQRLVSVLADTWLRSNLPGLDMTEEEEEEEEEEEK